MKRRIAIIGIDVIILIGCLVFNSYSIRIFKTNDITKIDAHMSVFTDVESIDVISSSLNKSKTTDKSVEQAEAYDIKFTVYERNGKQTELRLNLPHEGEGGWYITDGKSRISKIYRMPAKETMKIHDLLKLL